MVGIEASVTATVLDAARIPGLLDLLESLEAEHVSLYDGESAVELADVAPYLTPLAPGSAVNEWLFESAWGQSAGILIASQTSLEELRSHFRRLLMVLETSGEVLYFRPYDPRVLRAFLPTCDPDQLEQMFGPVAAYVVEAEDPAHALHFSLGAGSLITESMDLTRPPRPSRPKIAWKG